MMRWSPGQSLPARRILVGVLPGEGVGPEVIGCALEVLQSVAAATGLAVKIRTGGAIGREAEQLGQEALSTEVVRFCEAVFEDGGAILNGPGGGRYVYDLRREFDLFFKISPLQIANGVADASRVRPEMLGDLDVLITRENSEGVYQGDWCKRQDWCHGRLAEQRFHYTLSGVERFLEASAQLAKRRDGRLTVVWKESGVPAISQLWRECAEAVAREQDVAIQMVDVDLMAYRLIQEPSAFDVIAAPNLFGDILADLGAVLLGSRGVSYSGNFGEGDVAVYQTNHGAAYDLAGTDRANPAGQIFSLAMMLRESFGLEREAQAVADAVGAVWNDGWRTADVAVPGSRVIGTREMGQRVAQRVGQILGTAARKGRAA